MSIGKILKKILLELDHQEILIYLEIIYGSGSMHINPELSVQTIGKLKVNCNTNGKIKTIDYRALKDEEFSKRLEEMYDNLTKKDKAVVQDYILIPQNGNMKWIVNYKDEVVLYPCDDECPRPDMEIGHYPFILEYSFDWFSSTDFKWHRLKEYRRKYLLKECIRILAFDYNIPYNEYTEFVWAYTKDFEVEYVQKAYHCNSDNRQYFISYDKILRQNDSIVNFLFEAGQTLSSHGYNNFHRSLYWYQKAKEVSSITKSLEYQSYFHAIESLIEGETTVKSFHAFINDLFGSIGSNDKKFINDLYDRRSEITHGSFLFHKDTSGHTFNSEIFNDERTLQSIRSVTKKIILVWLYKTVGDNKDLINKYTYQFSINGISTN